MATWVPWTNITSAISSSTVTCFAGDTLGNAVIAGTTGGTNTLFYNNPSSSLGTWTASTSGIPTSNDITAVASTSGGQVMFATISSAIYYSTDSGVTWTSMTIGVVPTNISCVACSINSGTVTVAFGANGGFTYWTQNTTPSNYTVWNSPFTELRIGGGTANCVGISSNIGGTRWNLLVSDTGTGAAASDIYTLSNITTDNWATCIAGAVTYTSVACSIDGTAFIACSSGNGLNVTDGTILTSSDGINWVTRLSPSLLPYKYVGLNKDGTKLYACAGTIGLYYSLDSGSTWTRDTTTPPSPATTVNAVYVNPNITNNGLPLFIGLTSSSYKINYAGYNPSTNPICFKEGSKILCFVDGKEEYLPVETLKPGTFVKTYLHGYKAIDMIGHSKIYNPAHTLRGKNRLYVCKKEKYPEITEDLVITGCHSILVDSVTEKQYKDIEEFAGRIYVTDKLCRFPACLDDRAEPYTETGVHTIWHFALTHDDYYMNYGVYANGLLVETTSRRMMKDLSGMELV